MQQLLGSQGQVCKQSMPKGTNNPEVKRPAAGSQ